MTLFLTVLHVIVCLILVIVVLLQRGKGADIGAVFGGGGSTTVFGSRGAGNFLTKLTTGAAVIFMLTSLSLAYFNRLETQSTLFDDDGAPVTEEASPFAEPEEGAAPAPSDDPFAEVPPVEPAPEEAPAEPPVQ